LLVGGSRLPNVDELPGDLKNLAYRNAAQARPDPDFHGDMNRLIKGLEEIVGSPEPSVGSKHTIPSSLVPDALLTPVSTQNSSLLSERRREFYKKELARKQRSLAAVQDDLETPQSQEQELRLNNRAEQLLKDIDDLEKLLSN